MSGGLCFREPLVRTIVTSICAGGLAWFVSGLPIAHPDFAMLWTALRLPNPYDPEALKRALHWGPLIPVAFPYPPCSFTILAPFTMLPLRAAIVCWAALSGAALALSSGSKWAPFFLLVPPVLWALPGGQTSVLLGSVLFSSLLIDRERPIASGILVGFAIALKPQLSIIVAFGFLFARRWTTVTATVATFAFLTGVSAILFGPQQWIAWLKFLPKFLEMHEHNPILRRNEVAFGLPIWVRGLALIAGTYLTAGALRRREPLEAFISSVSAALIFSSHAMGYEFAMVAPAYAQLARQKGVAGIAVGTFILTPQLIWTFPGILDYMPRLCAIILLVTFVSKWPSQIDWRFGGRLALPHVNDTDLVGIDSPPIS